MLTRAVSAMFQTSKSALPADFVLTSSVAGISEQVNEDFDL